MDLAGEEIGTFEGTVEKETNTRYRMKQNNVILEISIHSPSAVWTTIREQGTKQFLSLVTTRKQMEAQIEITFHVRSIKSLR